VVHEVSGGVVRVNFEFLCFFVGEVFDARFSFEVKFDPEGLSVFVDPPESVGGVTIHVPVSVRSSSITHKDGDLMS